jgi:O-antigen/teichoic acid export membrane protein
MLRDFGIGSYIIQEKELTKARLKAAFGITMLAAWTIALGLYLSRHLIADFYREPALLQIMAWMSLNFVIIPFSSPVLALFKREMKFHLLMSIGLVSTIASAGTSIYLAYRGYGFMSLVWGSLANISTTALMATALRPKDSFVLPSLKESKHVFTFSGKSSLTNVIGQAGYNVAELVIGKSLGFSSVAIYSKAQTTINLFLQQFLGSIRNVYYPAIARQSRENKPLGPAFRKATVYVTSIAFPFFGFLALYAEEIILLMFGDQWLASSEIIRILAFGGVIYSIWSFAPNTLYALNKPGRVMKAEFLIQSFRVLAIVPAASISLKAVALAQVATYSFSLIIYLFILSPLIDLKLWRFLFQSIIPGSLIAIISLTVPLLIKQDLANDINNPFLLLVLAGIAFALSWIASILITNHPAKKDILSTIALRKAAT